MIDPVVLVGAGGSIGAVLRYLVGQLIGRETFPLSVLIVNVLGSFLFGLIVLTAPDESIQLFVGIGICGSFTTFSSFSFQAVHLWERERKTLAVVHVAANTVLCLGAVGLAWLVVELL